MVKNISPIHRRNFLLHLQERPDFDQPVLIKEAAREQPIRSQIDQLHNEYTITTQLANERGVRPAYAIEGTESQPMLVLEYIPGKSLAELISSESLDMTQKLTLAVNIATVLSCIHEQQVMHKDLSSSNILVSTDDRPSSQGGVYIIDFGLASSMLQENPSRFAPYQTLVGALGYISPEQTGRINRRVDYRTDLYSLGVVLFEVFTGQLPFESGDTLEMIHAHIARQPQPPHQIDDDIPAPVSEIILKLLAKNAEDRYQTAYGLQVDLKRCLDRWQSMGRIEPFELGGDDFTGRLQIPEKLYGRQAEIEQIQTILNRAATERPHLLLVAGYAGVGKTSLVHEFQKHVIAKQGIFIEGKFDQLQWTRPYSAWAQALTQLVENLLAESETSLAAWRETILESLGENGQILIDLIPDLERIIGLQPQVPQLGGIENQNRFNYYFNRFVSCLASPEHPLVIFLDDLQWIDPASLNLIETLLAVPEKSYILIIGAYRSNEVDPAHPLAVSQERMQAESDRVTVITLEGLSSYDTNHLLADSLQLNVPECRDLDKVLAKKSGGNPFFYRQLLYALEADKLLKFNLENRRWLWDDSLEQSIQAHGSVVDLMIEKIRTLPDETQHTLSLAACIGSRFDIGILDKITKQEKGDFLSLINRAIQEGLIIRSDGQFSFTHDRIQEASYALIPQSDLPQTHLKIGRTLLAEKTAEDLEGEIFAIVGHLNAGRDFINKESEKIDLARLNLKAGQKAKAASAYADAKEYIKIGLDLLDSDSWQKQYELTLWLHNENGELAYLTGRFDQIAPTLDLIRRHAKNIYDRVHIYMIQIEAETAQYKVAEALGFGLLVLGELGIDIPTEPTADDSQGLHEKFAKLLRSKPLEILAQMTAMSDKKAQAASSLLASVMSTAYIANPPLFPIISYNGAILTLEHGLDVWSPFFFGGVALINIASMTQEAPSNELINLIRFNKQLIGIIREMLENPVTAKSRSKGLMMLAFTLPWFEPIEQGVEISQATYNSGYETGDWLYASYGAIHFAIQGIAAGVNLNLYESQLSDYVYGLNRVGQKTTPQWLSIYLQSAQNFMEIPTTEPDQLNGTYFNENNWLPSAITANDISGRHFFYVDKLMLAYHFDVDDKLDEYAGLAEDFLSGALSLFSIPLFHLLFALSKLRLVGASDPENQEESMNLVDNSLRLMEIWSQSVPSTFQHKFDLIKAEKARVLGDLDSALDHYELAISGARENGFIHEEALANELYARFWLEKDNERFASLFMREAHSLYSKWGALAKAEHLTRRYPNLLVGRRIAFDETPTQTISDQTTFDLDLLTVLKASQDIASEIELDRLLTNLMTNVIENSGAQKGYLIIEQDGQWTIVAQADVDGAKSQITEAISVTDTDLLADSIVHYVAHTQETVVLEDASQSGKFSQDPYIQSQQTKSILCTPLINQGKISAILYLENDLAPQVLSPQRVNLLQLLSSQMAISIDNARIHNQLENLLKERSNALQSAEAQIRSIFESSPLGIALTTYEGEFLSTNKALQDMLRISGDELNKWSVRDFYADPADRDRLLAELQELGSVQDFGIQLRRKDGDTFFASSNFSQLVLEGNKVLIAMIEDVTKELKTEQRTAIELERERLARELHDAVTQTLFSASVIAEATPKIWESDQELGRQYLAQLPILLRGALAEMRSLLLELRPRAFKDMTLGQLLEPLADASRAYTNAEVTLEVESDLNIPEEVTKNLHRIVQECLNNIIKHAEASYINIYLCSNQEGVELRISDNGIGFDPQTKSPGSMGIDIMRDRARKIDAELIVESQPGSGTQIMITWPSQKNMQSEF